jgi:class 3 adenylate cyclase
MRFAAHAALPEQGDAFVITAGFHQVSAAVPQATNESRIGDWLLAPLGLFRRHIAGKIVIPYLLLIFVLALLATHTTMNLISGSLEERFQEELAGAGVSANEAMVKLESNNLALLRQMAFTVGVGEAVTDRDARSIERLLAPIAGNARVPYTDVFGADGSHLLALRSPDLGTDAQSRIDPNARAWAPVQSVRLGKHDQLGDKYTDVVFAPWGPLLVTAGPIEADGKLLGVIAIATPLDAVAARLSEEAGSKGLSLYTGDGRLLATTVRAGPGTLASTLPVPAQLAQDAFGQDRLLVRRVTIDERPYVEMLGTLAIRRQPVLLMGVGNLITIIAERGDQMRNIMIALFSGVVVLVLAVGLTLARQIARPVRALVDAAIRIRRNELDIELPVTGADETAVLTAAFNEMAGGLRERERSRVAIEKYMSPKVYQLIQNGQLRMGGESREITVLKTDIRDFTTLSEEMDPQRLVAFLNRYFERMVTAVAKYDGEVDKYMGDAILAKFGATEWYPDHARRAALAMIEMIEACEQFSAEAEAEGLPPIRMGIGANTGPAVVGNIGSPARMEYTIISSAVNTAQRIEELCKEFGWDILVSRETYEQAKDAIEVGTPWAIKLRGHSAATTVYPVLGRAGQVPAHRLQAYGGFRLPSWYLARVGASDAGVPGNGVVQGSGR